MSCIQMDNGSRTPVPGFQPHRITSFTSPKKLFEGAIRCQICQYVFSEHQSPRFSTYNHQKHRTNFVQALFKRVQASRSDCPSYPTKADGGICRSKHAARSTKYRPTYKVWPGLLKAQAMFLTKCAGPFCKYRASAKHVLTQ